MLLRKNLKRKIFVESENSLKSTLRKLPGLRRPSLQNHDLYTIQKYEVGDIIRDEKSGFTLEVIDEKFKFRGTGSGKGKGLKVVESVKKNQVFSWSEEPLIEMDLINYTQQDYVKNGWIVFGKLACRISSIPMLANARAPINGSEVEIGNTFLGKGVLPDSLASRYPTGLYAYLRATSNMQAHSNVVIHKYGNGNASSKWGQDPTVRRQQRNIRRYKESEKKLLLTKQRGHSICNECGKILPRNKNKKLNHPTRCDKVKA
jgi:hypothetical protein